MPNYAQIYSRFADRAVRQSAIDMETMIDQLASQGVPIDRIEQLMLDDLEKDGPIFGKFLRSLTGAAESSVMAAERQGDIVGTASVREDLQRFLGRSEFGLELDEADPEALEKAESDLADRLNYTWVATLINTCYQCLPLHGKTQSYADWLSSGLHPDTIHSGWTSTCHCSLIPAEMMEIVDPTEAGARKQWVDPIVREKIKGAGHTQRAIAQADIDRARDAVAKALETDEGASILRQLGKVRADEGD